MDTIGAGVGAGLGAIALIAGLTLFRSPRQSVASSEPSVRLALTPTDGGALGSLTVDF